MKNTRQRKHLDIAEAYFDYLSRHFPVMCASDEFHFLPRAENAAHHYDKLDHIDPDTIAQALAALREFRSELSTLSEEDDDLEKLLDIDLLRASINGFVIEFEQKRTWRHNPLLHLKIAFIGLDHALHKPAADRKQLLERTVERLSQIPAVLKQAAESIESVPEAYHQASLNMIDDCRQYIADVCHKVKRRLTAESFAGLLKVAQTADGSLDSFQRFVSGLKPKPDRLFAAETLVRTLTEHFLCDRSLEEIFRIAEEGWGENLARLDEVGSQIDPGRSWQQIYQAYYPSEMDESDTIGLYAREIENLKCFFRRQGFDAEALNAELEISETPVYLRSVRGAASFAAAYTSNPEEKSYFYITTRLAHQSDGDVQKALRKRFHREYRLLTAHEAVPGHHYLDAVRRRLKNPVRRQIESPLFYEGWASYAESLLAEYGYEQSALEVLVDLKRNLWRAARCLIDVGLAVGKITTADSLKLLETCGFMPREARRQIDRFRLNPGYQLCYSLGHYEFNRLKSEFGAGLGNRRFHELLLQGGQLPFHLLRKRLGRASRYGIEG